MTRRKFLIASIVAVQNSSFIYPSCQKCFSRVILVSKRFDCSKCDYTGESKNVTYRYKLSLKVSDANRVFAITVFGSCLDAFFGITATCLNRYIRDFNQVEGTLDSNSIQDLLIQAVQACFVGRTFIFGVTNFENRGEQASASDNFLPKCPRNDRCIKELVACQISLPNSDITGYTVINYFDQLLQSSNFRHVHYGPQLSDGPLLEGEHPSTELSSLGSSGSSSCFVQSSGRDRLSRLWQQFLGLAPVVTQLADDEEFSVSEQSKADDVPLQQRERASSAEVTNVNNYHEPVQDSHSPHLSLGEENKREKLDTESVLPSSHLTAILNNYPETGAASFLPFKMKKSLLESDTNLLPGTLETEEKCSQPKLTHHQNHSSDLSSSFQKRTPSPRQEASVIDRQEGDPEIWDDLPFSESLNAFIAGIENENIIAQPSKCHKGKDINPVDGHYGRLLANPPRATGNIHVPHVRSEVKDKNCAEGSVLSSCGSERISTSQKEMQQDNTDNCFSVSISGKEISDCAIPNVNVSVLSQTPKDFRTYLSFKKNDSFPQNKVEIIPSPNTSGNVHSCANTKYSVKCGERQSSEIDRTATSLCSEKHVVFSDACARNKGHSIWLQNQEGSFTTCRELVQNSNTRRYHNKNVSTNVCALMPESQKITSTTVKENLHQNLSPPPDSNYNASADLFDFSAKEMETVAEYIDKSQGILSTWETVLTERRPVSNFPLSPIDDNCSHFQRRSSSQNILRHPRTHSSPYFQSDSDYDLGDSQEFVPYSQSTPIAPLPRRLSVHRMKDSFQKYPRFYTSLHPNYKTMMTFEDGIQQPTPDCLKNENTTSLRSRNTSVADDSQQMFSSSSPTLKFFETNFDGEKAFPSPVLPTSEMFELSFRGPGKWPAACSTPNQAEGPQNKKRKMEQSTDKDLIGKEFHLKNKYRVTAMKQITPKLENCKDSRGCSSKNATLRTDSLSNVKCRLLFSENEAPSAAEVPSDWSPELFTQRQPNPVSKHLLKIPVWKL
ncbi:DNA damage-induced apoptosis suppressor protein [Dromiciops gliroides]|uniref:DNA damage-induced apoptosis suppressor protein n=1 Tax=Dromiciops gliroides TaxID=33562 RepID=UPI001CC7FBE0|nr:DNA damage-induced apoptosis suppressor protein [Dromiciops gliroides]